MEGLSGVGSLVTLGRQEVRTDFNRLFSYYPLSTNGSRYSYYQGRSGHSSVVQSDDAVMVMGGTVSSGLVSNEIWKSNDGGVSWALVTDSAWETGGKDSLFNIFQAYLYQSTFFEYACLFRYL
jgi:hypothetical protein